MMVPKRESPFPHRSKFSGFMLSFGAAVNAKKISLYEFGTKDLGQDSPVVVWQF